MFWRKKNLNPWQRRGPSPLSKQPYFRFYLLSGIVHGLMVLMIVWIVMRRPSVPVDHDTLLRSSNFQLEEVHWIDEMPDFVLKTTMANVGASEPESDIVMLDRSLLKSEEPRETPISPAPSRPEPNLASIGPVSPKPVAREPIISRSRPEPEPLPITPEIISIAIPEPESVAEPEPETISIMESITSDSNPDRSTGSRPLPPLRATPISVETNPTPTFSSSPSPIRAIPIPVEGVSPVESSRADRNRSGSTQKLGNISEYHASVYEAFHTAWAPPLSLSESQSNFRVRARIEIARDGRIIRARILQGSGNEEFDGTVVKAIQRTPRIKPLPTFIRGSSYTVILNFDQ